MATDTLVAPIERTFVSLGKYQASEEPAESCCLKLKCVVQHYAWGRRAEDSEVAKLCQGAGQPIDVSKPFAELWMGTHPSAPSSLADGACTGTPLATLLRDCPALLGAAAGRFGHDLPYLLKVLSVNTALSIQSHPDRELAQRLHAQRPEVYRDGNHKPEMALALTRFEALLGFAPHAHLAAALAPGAVPELRDAVGKRAADAYLAAVPGTPRRAALREAFTALMTCEPHAAAAAVAAMCARLRGLGAAAGASPLSAHEALVLRLDAQYPGDVGVLAAWFLNLVTLQPGQAIFLAANEPHAYVSGEIVEAMATSDNVLRAGLTPKDRDTDVLCASLTYAQREPEVLLGEPALPDVPGLALYRPPFAEFELWRLVVPAGRVVSLPAAPGPVISLVQRGAGRLRGGAREHEVHRGDVHFVAAGVPLRLAADQELIVYFATCNGLGFDAAGGKAAPAV